MLEPPERSGSSWTEALESREDPDEALDKICSLWQFRLHVFFRVQWFTRGFYGGVCSSFRGLKGLLAPSSLPWESLSLPHLQALKASIWRPRTSRHL